MDSRTAMPDLHQVVFVQTGPLGHADRQFFGLVDTFQSRIQKPLDSFRFVAVFPHTSNGLDARPKRIDRINYRDPKVKVLSDYQVGRTCLSPHLGDIFCWIFLLQ